MLLGILKMLGNLLGMAFMIKMVKERLHKFTHTFQETLITKTKKIGVWLLLVCVIWSCLGMGIRFLLWGLACWLNHLLSSTYVGFWIVSLFCFLGAGWAIWILRKRIRSQEISEKKIED